MQSASQKTIILLVGPKGAGKSHIGRELAALFKAFFLRIEQVWQEMSPDRMDFDSPAFMEEGLRRSLKAVAGQLSGNDAVILESSGAFDQFPSYLASLREMGTVCLVNVRAPCDQCLARIRARDQSLHVPVPEDVIENLNRRSESVRMDWDVMIVNHPFITRETLKEKFLTILEPRA
jgi:shikimate kinase